MKEAELLNQMLGLGQCFVGEYRGSKIELRGFVDKVDGKAREYISVSHLFEFGTRGVQSIRVDEFVPREVTDPKEVKVPFSRGKSYLIQLRSMEIDKKGNTAKLNTDFAPVEIG